MCDEIFGLKVDDAPVEQIGSNSSSSWHMPFGRCMALFGALMLNSPSHADTPVDLELVLAVDASSSVNEVEYALQIGGIAAGFRDRSVIDAIGRGLHGRIAIAMLVWAEPLGPKDMTNWHVISGAEEAHAFAALIETRPRSVGGGTTGIGDAIAAAVAMLRDNEIDGVRSVVDVSGDGIETPPESATDIQEINVGIARSLAEANAITVNGLAILNEVAKLDQWYRRNVITGSNSFVMSADDYSQFAAAMRAKLLREIDTGEAITKRSKLHLR